MRYGIDIPDNPRTIQEKLIWLQFYDSANYLKPMCADKLRLHEYCADKLGEDICVPLLAVFDKPEDFNPEILPDKFAVKSNHSNNQVILCRDKTKLKRDEVVATMKRWLSKPFGIATCEPHYMYIERKCYAEELLLPGNTDKSVVDYRLWMFNGSLGLISVNAGFGHGPITRFNSDFVLVREWNEPNCINFTRPDYFNTMKEYARKLAEPFKFVRVDFYEAGGRPYLGEMTFVPGAARFSYRNPRTAIMLGDMLRL